VLLPFLTPTFTYTHPTLYSDGTKEVSLYIYIPSLSPCCSCSINEISLGMDIFTHLTAGTVAGMTGVLVDYPLDTLKTRMQVSCPTSPRSYAQCAARLYRQGGVNAFYRGLSVPFAAQGAEAAIIFAVYNTTLQHLQQAEQGATAAPDRSSAPSIWASSSYWKASACAGLAVSLVLTPVEMVKCNLQVESGRSQWQRRHHTVRSLVGELYATNGLRGFYRGMTGTVTRAVCGNVAYFLSYEQCKRWLIPTTLPAAATPSSSSQPQHPQRAAEKEEEGKAVTPAWCSMLAGGISGCLYWSIAYPADVAKTQMQVCSRASNAGFSGTLRHFYRNGGVRALYRGWGVTTVRACLSSAVVFTTYERCSSAIAGLCPVHVCVTRAVAAE
jgi:hypothetical protein